MEKLKFKMTVEVETDLDVTASVATRKAAIQSLREVILPTVARYQADLVNHDAGTGQHVNLWGVRVTGDSTNSVRS